MQHFSFPPIIRVPIKRAREYVGTKTEKNEQKTHTIYQKRYEAGRNISNFWGISAAEVFS